MTSVPRARARPRPLHPPAPCSAPTRSGTCTATGSAPLRRTSTRSLLDGDEPVAEADIGRITMTFFSGDTCRTGRPVHAGGARRTKPAVAAFDVGGGSTARCSACSCSVASAWTTSSGASAEPIAGTVMMYLLALSRNLRRPDQCPGGPRVATESVPRTRRPVDRRDRLRPDRRTRRPVGRCVRDGSRDRPPGGTSTATSRHRSGRWPSWTTWWRRSTSSSWPSPLRTRPAV